MNELIIYNKNGYELCKTCGHNYPHKKSKFVNCDKEEYCHSIKMNVCCKPIKEK